MSSREHPLYTIKNDCQDCYKCVRECPVKAIKIEDNSAQIEVSEGVVETPKKRRARRKK